MYQYYQQVGGEEAWKPVPVSQVPNLQSPMFVTVLATNEIISKQTPKEDRDRVRYSGPLYFDWDGDSIEHVIPNVLKLLEKLQKLGVDMAQIKLFATGQKGFHCEIPEGVFIEKPSKGGTQNLPVIFKEMALELAVDTLDFVVYSSGMGRAWRQPNVLRTNGKYKVAITYAELKEMTPEGYLEVCSAPRPIITPEPSTLAIDLAVMFDKASQKVKNLLAKRSKRKGMTLLPSTQLPSVEALMANKGIKEGTGFHPIALQLGIYANERGWKEDELIEKCTVLIEEHQGDGNRYNTPSKRDRELRRMFGYTCDNPCYAFSGGALKVLMSHAAPDLAGMQSSKEEIDALIETPMVVSDINVPNEYNDLAGVTLNKFGVYANSEDGPKRVSAISFENVKTLRSTESGIITMVEADVFVNGKLITRTPIELDTFHSAASFNKFAARLGHAFQGNDSNVRGLYLRLMEKSKAAGSDNFAVSREGLDVINILNHPDERLRRPFLIWADGKGVVLEPRAAETGVNISFQGYPDPKGQYKSDLADTPNLAEFVADAGNKEKMAEALEAMMTCHTANVAGSLLGWYVSCFYRMIFHKAYGQFPMLHINGSAGVGKCLGVDTPVLMADGSIRKVQDVKQGEYLLGPDGGKRKVLSTCKGQSKLYKVTPVKGTPYIVNGGHILSLKLSSGAKLPAEALAKAVSHSGRIINMKVEDYASANNYVRKELKGWRSDAVEFNTEKQPLPMDPYCLGYWLGDGSTNKPAVSKPYCNGVAKWIAYGETLGDTVRKSVDETKCPLWYSSTGRGRNHKSAMTAKLQQLNLVGNKHIPEAYKTASFEDRLQLLAGLIDSDGSLSHNNYDWISKDLKLAEDFAFICRSAGLAAYVTPKVCRIKSTGFSGTYYRVNVSGDTAIIPCVDKKAAPRKQLKRVTVTGIAVTDAGHGAYYGFELDGDHLFLLGDFTVTHNTAYNKAMLSLFYYNQEPKIVSPTSTTFAITFSAAGSASIPLVIDEYKPHEMPQGMHDRLKGMLRDAYNCKEVQRGGGTRENDDYRSLSSTTLSAPILFIGEAAEEETAVTERVVLVTMTKASPIQAGKNFTKFMRFTQDQGVLSIIGKYMAADIVNNYSVDKLKEEFTPLLLEARTKFLLQEGDMEKLSQEELQQKFAMKDRIVFNFTVAKFGVRKFGALLENIYGNRFKPLIKDLEDKVFERMNDLSASTQPEWLKVLNCFVDLTVAEDGSAFKLTQGRDYGFVKYGGMDCVEMNLRSCYAKYRQYARAIGIKPLYSGELAFMHGMRDASAVVAMSYVGGRLRVPGGTTVFNTDQLAQLGVRPFMT